MSGALFITGHRGLLGSALLRAAADRNVITAPRAELDLRDAAAVEAFFHRHRPAAVIHAAALNGGIPRHLAAPAAMLGDNLSIACNVIHAAQRHGASCVYVSSACVYSGGGAQDESMAATTFPDGPTAGYALAKITAMRLGEALREEYGARFCSIIPCNLYGPGDNYDPAEATVVAGMMRRMAEAAAAGAPEFALWGSGNQTREFLHADDLAAACLLLADHPSPPVRVNAGPGAATSMRTLAEQLQHITGYRGEIVCDLSRPEGAPRPGLDAAKLRLLGWQPRLPLEEGLQHTWNAFTTALAGGTLRGG